MGFLGAGSFGFLPSGGSGGSGPTTGVGTLSLVVGDVGAPVAGTSTYTNATLVGKTVDFIIVGNVPMFAFGSPADFSFDTGTGTITLPGTNVWPPNGSAIFIQYETP